MSEKFQQGAGSDRYILGKSTLISTSTLNIPMPRGAVAPKEADWVLREGLRALGRAIRQHNQQNPDAARGERLTALQHFGQARARYVELGDPKGKAIANFCRAYVQLLDENLEQAKFDCQVAIDDLLDDGTSGSSGPK